MSVRVALVGCGAWGKNLARALAGCRRAELVAVADPDRDACARAGLSSSLSVPDLDAALALAPDAVVVATPSPSHAALALRALAAGADVLVEKPLALDPADADACATRAAELGRIGMVGHVLRHHPAVVRLLALAREGAIGEPTHLAATRLSIRGERSCSPLWTLGPHDLSILHALDTRPLASVRAREAANADVVLLEAALDGGLSASIALSCSHPHKERRTAIAGREGTITFDDVRAPDTLVVTRRGAATTHEVRVPWTEPLAVEVDHFLRCVETRERPVTPFEEGAWVVRALARAERPRAHAAEVEHAVG